MRTVEVIAVMGDAVVDVKHVTAQRRSVATKVLVATSAIALVIAMATFLWGLHRAADNAAARRHHVSVLQKPAYSFRPARQNLALDVAMFGALGIGIVAAMAALLRVRRARTSSYRVGTAPDVDLPLATAACTEFPLIACIDDEYVVTYDERFEGELSVGGSSISLFDLALSERARASSLVADAIEIPIPSGARIRVHFGAITIFATSIDVAAPPSLRGIDFDGRAFVHCVVSLAVHLYAVWLVGLGQSDAPSDLNLGVGDPYPIRIGPDVEELPPEEDELPSGPLGDALRRRQEEVEAEPSHCHPGQMHIMPEPPMSREDAIDAARIAGFIESPTLRDSIATLSAATDFASIDELLIYGGILCDSGGDDCTSGMLGGFGMGRLGVPVPDGGGTGWGTICGGPPMGCRYGTNGRGSGTGEGYGLAGGLGPFTRRHIASAPPLVTLARPTYTDGLDREVLRRYFKRNSDAFTACYEKGLLVHPTLSGTISAQFLVSPDGTVSVVQTSGLDDEVRACVASVVKSIKFPAPKNGGTVQVTYPLTFRVPG